MFGFTRISASSAARIFVVSVCLVIALLEVWSASREHDAVLEASTRAGANVARALSQHADETFNEVDIVLLGLQERLESEGRAAAELNRVHDLMVMHVRRLPQLAGLFVYDENGRWIVNSQPSMETKYNNADRDYFIYHRDHRTDKPFIGVPVRSKSTGQWVLTISRRIDKIDGSFGGVVLGTIDLGFLQRFYQEFDIGHDGAIMLGSLDGTILLRRPLLPDTIGKRLDSSPLFQQHILRERAGATMIRSTQDGVMRINNYRHLADHRLFITVAMSRDEVLGDWTRHAWMRALGVALLLVALCYGGSRMVAQVRRREAAEHDAVEARQKIEALYQTLEAQSQRDGLTGVFNRRYLDDALAAELSRLHRAGGALSLIMVDVDHFKQFNDTYGHAAGDICLQRVAASIQHAAQRKCDVVARYGGEEFAVLLPECGKTGAMTVARSLMACLHQDAITHAGGASGIVTVSVGVASISAQAGFQVTPREMIEVADEGLYLAKNQGRDRVVFRDFPCVEMADELCLEEDAS